MPKEIGNLINLRTLSLNNNMITELPKEIGKLTNLNGLYLDKIVKQIPKNLRNTTIFSDN